jgi:putative DNA primase/helicase
VDLPSDAGRHMGVFEHLHEFKTAKALALHLNAACDTYHGAVGIAWLEYITGNLDAIGRELPAAVAALADKLIEQHAGAESQVHRVIRRFALLAAAGELASKAGLTGWPAGVATAGIGQCVNAWLNHRGGAENMEERRILERLRDFIGRNWQGRFIPWERATDERAPSKSEAVGYRKDAGTIKHADNSGETPQQEFYITPEGWVEIFRGMDPQRAALVLLEKGVLVPGKWTRDGITSMRPYCREYLPGMGRRQAYRTVSNPFALLGDSLDGGGDAA